MSKTKGQKSRTSKLRKLLKYSSVGLGDGVSCFYCGNSGNLSKEHVIPKALKVRDSISGVCVSCNNGALSELDKELCSRSPISIVAAHEFPSHIHYIWDTSGRILLEGRFDLLNDSIHLYPQMVVIDGRKQIFANADDIAKVGKEYFRQRLIYSMLDSFQAFEQGDRRRLIFEKVEVIAEQYLLPPRIFCRKISPEFGVSPLTFIARYLNSEDRRTLLNALDTWNTRRDFNSTSRLVFDLGSRTPGIQVFYDQVKVVRAILKIGLNLLGLLCQGTPIIRNQHKDTVEKILGNVPLQSSDFQFNGFIPASQLNRMLVEDGTHEFWVLRTNNSWQIYSSYFGGRIGTKTTIVGPSSENWVFARVVAKYTTTDQCEISRHRVVPSRGSFPSDVTWINPKIIMPTIKISNVVEKRFTTPKRD